MASSQGQSNYIRGAAILAATVAITKVIGAVYKIPLYNILGDEGSAHFGVIYTIYNLVLTISTAGIPVALSRLISGARERGMRNQVNRYFRVGMAVFGAVGILCAALMFLLAQQLADMMGDYEVAAGVRVLAPAVFFACVISVYRGYSQGHKDMRPTSVSQLIEVLGKLVFGLAAAWALAEAGHSSADVAAGAIVGVTIGLGVTIPVLALFKRRSAKQTAGVSTDTPASAFSTAKEILRVGIPITLGSSIMNVITLIDTKLVLSRLQTGAGLSYESAKVLYGVYTKALTLFNIPSAFITPVVVSVVPFIAAHLAEKRNSEAKGVIESALKLTNLVAMPAAAGLCVLAKPIFNVLYPGSHEAGPAVLAVLGIGSYFVCTYIVTNGVLQAAGHERLALVGLPVGGVIKVVVNWLLVGYTVININGAPIGTLVCYVVITALNLFFICRKLPEKPALAGLFLRPLGCAVLMAGAAWGTYGLSDMLLVRLMGEGGLQRLICLCAAVGVGVVVYGVLAVLLRAVTRSDMLLLPKGEKLANMLHIR